MATVTMKAPAPGGLSNKARELMEAINTEAGKHNVWVRTQANAPAQKPWFSETSGEGSGQLATGRVAVNQMKTAPYMWKWNEYTGYLKQISEIASKADVSPIEFADRQSILLLNPGLNGRLQVTNTIRCAISIYNPGDVAPVHLHSPNASRTILSNKGGYTVVEGERVTANRGDLILTPNGTWHDHGNDSDEPVHLDRHARLAADGIPRRRLGRSQHAGRAGQHQRAGGHRRRKAIRATSTATAASSRPSSTISAASAMRPRRCSISAAQTCWRCCTACARKRAIRTKASRSTSSIR